jgi:hypothetical protein
MYDLENEIDNAQAQCPAPAHFERFYLQLLNNGKIQPFRGSINEQPPAIPRIPQEIIDYITSPRISVFEQRKRYANDKEFKRYYDLYATAQLKAQVAAEEKEESLTVEQYNAMSRIEVVKKYRASAGFRRGVDALIAQGKI